MLENQDMSAPIKLAEGYNPFSDEDVVPQVQPQVEVAPTANEQQNVDNTANTSPDAIVSENQQQTQQTDYSTFNPDSFIKERFGFDTVDEAEEEFLRLIEEREQSPEFDFSDDVSRTLFDAIREGKTDDVYQILNEQKRIDKLTNSELTTEIAAEIVKTNIQNKFKDLSADEVDLLFYDQFFVPLKPEQGYDETDEDYSEKLRTWQAQADYTEKRLMIEAKVLRPEIAKLRSEINLPDIYNEAGREAQYQEEFEYLQQARSVYERTLDSEFQSFNGFNVSVKDDDVEIPISFNVAEDERLALKQELSDFDGEAYLENRWFNEEGKPNVRQIMADKYVLENLPRILQKVANEAASQRLLAHLKKSGNINLNQTPTPQGTAPSLNPNAAIQEQLANWAFSS
jgi:hypothetical protein